MGKELNIRTETGGFPWANESFGFLQDAAREQSADAAKAFGGETLLLYGLELSGGNLTAGAFLYQDEIYKIDQVSAGAVAPTDTLHIVTTQDALDPTTFQDLSSKNVHDIRKVEFAAPGGLDDLGFTLADLDDLRAAKTIITELIKNGILSTLYDDIYWHAPALDSGYNETEQLLIRAEANAFRMRGRIAYTNVSGTLVATITNTAFRPAADRTIGVDMFDTGLGDGRLLGRAWVTIKSNGQITFEDTKQLFSPTGNDEILFDGSFYTK